MKNSQKKKKTIDNLLEKTIIKGMEKIKGGLAEGCYEPKPFPKPGDPLPQGPIC